MEELVIEYLARTLLLSIRVERKTFTENFIALQGGDAAKGGLIIVNMNPAKIPGLLG